MDEDQRRVLRDRMRALLANWDDDGCAFLLERAMAEDPLATRDVIEATLQDLSASECMLLLGVMMISLRAGDEAPLPIVAQCLRVRTEHNVQLRCVIALNRFESETVASAFDFALDSQHGKVVQVAAGWFGNSSPQINAAPLVRLLDHASEKMRLATCMFLARKERIGPRVLATMADLARSPHRSEFDDAGYPQFHLAPFDFADFHHQVKQRYNPELVGY